MMTSLSSMIDELSKPDFSDRLEDPLKSCFARALASSAPADELELALRQHLMQLQQANGMTKEATVEGIGHFWTQSLQLCYHVSVREEDNAKFKELNVRKLIFVLLEDALESLTVGHCQILWEKYVEPMFPIMFSDVIWKPAASTAKSFPGWLPLLKLCNGFIRRLDTNHEPAWAARIMLLLAQVFPLSEKSASMKWGSRGNSDTETLIETQDEYDAVQQHQTSSAAAKTLPHGNYSFYKSFWSLQLDFAAHAIHDLSSFLSRLETLLHALETTQVPGQDTNETAIESLSAQSLLATKYLVSSRLLPIQLVDLQFRICILSQFLMVAHNLGLEAPSVATSLAPLQVRARNLLPSAYLKMLEGIMNSSELQWRQWKKSKCPDLETNVEAIMATVNVNKRKRRRPLESDSNGADGNATSAYARIDLRKDLPQICSTMKQLVPSVEQHLEEYVEAIDPDSGIEAEYHPKNNAFFNWQALRLLSYQNLGDFDRLHPNGDYEAMVRHVWQRDKNVVIPGSAPEYIDEAVEDVEDEPAPEDDDGPREDGAMVDQDEAIKPEEPANNVDPADDDTSQAEPPKNDADVASQAETKSLDKGVELKEASDNDSVHSEHVSFVDQQDTSMEQAAMEDVPTAKAGSRPDDVPSKKEQQDSIPISEDKKMKDKTLGGLQSSTAGREREPERSDLNRGRGRVDRPNHDNNRRGGSADSGRNPRLESNNRGPSSGDRRDDSRLPPLDRRWEPAGRRDDRGGPPRRDDRGRGQAGGQGRGSNRRHR